MASTKVVCDRPGDGRSLAQGSHREIFWRPLTVLQKDDQAMTAPSGIDPAQFLHEHLSIAQFDRILDAMSEGRTTPENGSTARSATAPTWSRSSPTASH